MSYQSTSYTQKVGPVRDRERRMNAEYISIISSGFRAISKKCPSHSLDWLREVEWPHHQSGKKSNVELGCHSKCKYRLFMALLNIPTCPFSCHRGQYMFKQCLRRDHPNSYHSQTCEHLEVQGLIINHDKKVKRTNYWFLWNLTWPRNFLRDCISCAHREGLISLKNCIPNQQL